MEVPLSPSQAKLDGSEYESGSESECDDFDKIGIALPTLDALKECQATLSNMFYIGMMHHKDSLLEWYSERPQFSITMPKSMDTAEYRERLAEWYNSRPSLLSYLIAEKEEEEPEEEEEETIFELQESDLEPCFNSEGRLGCEHYIRNCKVHCVTCNRFFPCRLCHDEEENHQLPRTETKYMLCLLCKHPQKAGQFCRKCRERIASYYCSICKLWSDDEEKSIFHCADCGICRIGKGIGVDTFHCHTCGVCMSLAEEHNHRCFERSAHSNCPICLEYLFNGTAPWIFMECGHPIHKACYDVYTEHSYKCPVCAKSIVGTSALFRVIDDEVAHEKLPPDLASINVDIKCNDCRGRSRVPFHLAGLKCSICKSYNTVKL